MIKALLRAHGASLYSTLFHRSGSRKKHGAGMRALILLLAVYVVCCLMLAFGMTFGSLCKPLNNAGLNWLYFAIVGLLIFLVSLFASMFTAQTQLFEARDNQMLLAMPIPPAAILGSRMSVLLLMNLLFEVLIAVPALAVYWMQTGFSFLDFVFLLPCLLVMPFLVMAFSCLLGWLISVLSGKLRFKNLFTVLFSVLFLVAYLVVYTQLQTYIGKLITHGESIAAALKRAVFPIYHFGMAVAGHKPLSLLVFALCAILPFVLAYGLLARNFIRIATASRSSAKIEYKEKAMKAVSARRALLGRELRRFFASPVYMINAGIGLIFLILLPAILLFKRDLLPTLLQAVPGAQELLLPICCFALALVSAMNFISAPSVSLEGKNLWIVRSLPVESSDILLSKAYAHMAVCLPVVAVSALLAGVALHASAPFFILLLLLPGAATVFTALLGVVINLHFPKLDWVNETIAIKQGISTVIAMFASMGIIALPLVLYLTLLNSVLSPVLYLFLCVLLFAALSLWMVRYLKTKGPRLLEAL